MQFVFNMCELRSCYWYEELRPNVGLSAEFLSLIMKNWNLTLVDYQLRSCYLCEKL